MAQKDSDPTNLHDLAVDAQVDIHKLAVGLAHMGADPQAVQSLTKMAGVIADVAKQLAAGPLPGQAGPAGPGQAPGGAPPAGPGGTQPIPAPNGAPATPPAAGPMAAGAAATHAMMMEAAQRRGAGGR